MRAQLAQRSWQVHFGWAHRSPGDSMVYHFDALHYANCDRRYMQRRVCTRGRCGACCRACAAFPATAHPGSLSALTQRCMVPFRSHTCSRTHSFSLSRPLATCYLCFSWQGFYLGKVLRPGICSICVICVTICCLSVHHLLCFQISIHPTVFRIHTHLRCFLCQSLSAGLVLVLFVPHAMAYWRYVSVTQSICAKNQDTLQYWNTLWNTPFPLLPFCFLVCKLPFVSHTLRSCPQHHFIATCLTYLSSSLHAYPVHNLCCGATGGGTVYCCLCRCGVHTISTSPS